MPKTITATENITYNVRAVRNGSNQNVWAKQERNAKPNMRQKKAGLAAEKIAAKQNKMHQKRWGHKNEKNQAHKTQAHTRAQDRKIKEQPQYSETSERGHGRSG